ALLEVRAKMLEIVALDALRGGGKSEALEDEPLVGGNRKELGAVAPLYTVIALLQLTVPGVLSLLRKRLRASLGALSHTLPFKDEVVPPNFGVLRWSVNCHISFPFRVSPCLSETSQDRGHTHSELRNYPCVAQGGPLAISGGHSKTRASGWPSET